MRKKIRPGSSPAHGHPGRRRKRECGRDVLEQVRDYIKQLEAARKNNRYQQARNRAVARLRKGFDLHATPLPSRDELHQRQGPQMRKALMDLNKTASRNPSGYGPEDVERLVDESRAAKKEKRTD